MAQINDQIMYCLGLRGYEGSINDRMRLWLLDNYGEHAISQKLNEVGGYEGLRKLVCVGEGEAPVSTSSASFSPEPSAGEETEVDEGDWESIEPVTYSYQWQLGGVDIVGATAKTILVLAGFVGQALRCLVTATNSFGFSVSITAAIVVVI